MASSGIVRGIDALGRVVLPIELRRSLELGEHDRVEILAEEDRLILRKYAPNCLFCGSGRELKEYRGKCVCAKCTRASPPLR